MFSKDHHWILSYPDESSPYPHNLKNHLNIILQPVPKPSKLLFTSHFPPEILYQLLASAFHPSIHPPIHPSIHPAIHSLYATCLTNPILRDLINLIMLMKSKNREDLHLVTFFICTSIIYLYSVASQNSKYWVWETQATRTHLSTNCLMSME